MIILKRLIQKFHVDKDDMWLLKRGHVQSDAGATKTHYWSKFGYFQRNAKSVALLY
jgi:hypothetical protein